MIYSITNVYIYGIQGNGEVENTEEPMTPEYFEFHQKTLKHRDELSKLNFLKLKLQPQVKYLPHSADRQKPSTDHLTGM